MKEENSLKDKTKLCKFAKPLSDLKKQFAGL